MARGSAAPGFYRAGVLMVLGVAFSDPGSPGLVRMSTGPHHLPALHLARRDPDGLADRGAAQFLIGSAALTIGLLGDRRPTVPRTTQATGAQLEDYFRVNTDHKVIGIQYTVTSFFSCSWAA